MNNYQAERLAQDEKFIEIGANLEHDRWARWQEYMFSKSFFPEIASQVESMDLDSSPDGLPETKDFNFGVKTGWNSLRDKLAGCVIIPKECADRWFRQVATKYEDLSEKEKERDRKETRNYLPLLLSRDQALLEAFKRDVGEWAKSKEKSDSGDMVDPFFSESRAYNQAIDDFLYLLKDYNLKK